MEPHVLCKKNTKNDSAFPQCMSITETKRLICHEHHHIDTITASSQQLEDHRDIVNTIDTHREHSSVNETIHSHLRNSTLELLIRILLRVWHN